MEMMETKKGQGGRELLKIEALSKSFGKKKALCDVNLSLEKGRIVGLLGPNGSGKTTLIKLINGLLRPDTGSIQIEGYAPGPETKAMISYLPDRVYTADWMRVKDLLKLFSDFYKDFRSERAKEMLRSLGISEKDRIRPMSKGTREKVQLVMVMSRDARLYLLDEPIGGVDPAARDFILRTILTNYSPDSTVLISTHLISDIEKTLDEVIFLKEGRVVLKDGVDHLRETEGKSLDTLFRDMFSVLPEENILEAKDVF
ncbi:MAG: ABC transporter ATP-binding protein [Eubacteriales bacterium]|nr:ABC transporter ATP-binding protein [Eubacteriales bacterium]